MIDDAELIEASLAAVAEGDVAGATWTAASEAARRRWANVLKREIVEAREG